MLMSLKQLWNSFISHVRAALNRTLKYLNIYFHYLNRCEQASKYFMVSEVDSIKNSMALSLYMSSTPVMLVNFWMKS